jgi:hypothetical protein
VVAAAGMEQPPLRPPQTLRTTPCVSCHAGICAGAPTVSVGAENALLADDCFSRSVATQSHARNDDGGHLSRRLRRTIATPRKASRARRRVALSALATFRSSRVCPEERREPLSRLALTEQMEWPDLMRWDREATGAAEWIASPAEELHRGRSAGLVGVWVLGAASGGVLPRAVRRQRRRAHPGCCAG